jgi:hypothetical protein
LVNRRVPAIVNLGFLSTPAAVFVTAMLVGIALYELVNRLAMTRTTVTVDA